MDKDFSESWKKIAWLKARKVEGIDPDMFRKDACGAWIKWAEFENNENPFGWVIEHIFPITKGGKTEEINIRAIQIQNNLSKSDDYPSYTATITAEGMKNIFKKRNLIVNQELREKLKKYEL